MKKLIQSILKSLLLSLSKNLTQLLLAAIGGGVPAYFFLLKQKVVEAPIYKVWSPIALALLISLTIFFFLLWLKIFNKYARFHEACGVLWDKQNKMRCKHCKKSLKYSSHQSKSIFYCSDPNCNNKHVLRDLDGNEITERQAIELKNKT